MEPAKLMGFEIPGDQKVPVSVRDWNAQKLALWRSRGLSELAVREAETIVARCRHLPGCPGADDDAQPCTASSYQKTGESEEVLVDGCPDREIRMSALVILNAARQLAPADARKPAEPYFAPSREYYSEVLAALGATEIENEMLRAALREAGLTVPTVEHTSETNEAPQLAKETE